MYNRFPRRDPIPRGAIFNPLNLHTSTLKYVYGIATPITVSLHFRLHLIQFTGVFVAVVCLFFDGLVVYLLVEVQLDKNERDRYQMLLQAVCTARLGRCLFNDNPFMVVALYIENTSRVTRYFVFQPDGTDPRLCGFESKQSRVFSLVLGFLCQGRPRLDAAVQVVCYYIRDLQPGIDDTK